MLSEPEHLCFLYLDSIVLFHVAMSKKMVENLYAGRRCIVAVVLALSGFKA
jgi:hypothetical protein